LWICLSTYEFEFVSQHQTMNEHIWFFFFKIIYGLREFVDLCLSKSFWIYVCLSNEHWICLILCILFGLENLCLFESSWVGLSLFKFVSKFVWVCLKVWKFLSMCFECPLFKVNVQYISRFHYSILKLSLCVICALYVHCVCLRGVF